MAAPVVSDLPTAPQRGDPESVFTPLANNFVAALQPLVVDVNALGSWMNGTATVVTTNSSDARNAAINAQTSADAASASEANAASSASSAASSATSTGTALAAANAILGLGIGTSYIDGNGDLIMSYDEGTVTVPPYINANGEFIVEY